MIHEAFTSAEFVAKLVSLLSLEENKGQDKYSPRRVAMFKVQIFSLLLLYMYIFSKIIKLLLLLLLLLLLRVYLEILVVIWLFIFNHTWRN